MYDAEYIEYIGLLGNWTRAIVPLRDPAFNALLNFAQRNPQFVQHLLGTAPPSVAAVNSALLAGLVRAGAVEAGEAAAARLTIRAFVARLAATLGVAEKPSPPPVMAAIFVGAVLLVGCTWSGDSEKYAAIPSYSLYLETYMRKCAMIRRVSPWAQLVSPQNFDDWYADNRT